MASRMEKYHSNGSDDIKNAYKRSEKNENLYQQGLPRFFSKKNRYDFYWPQLANIGEVAIKNKEIYAQGPSSVDGSGNAS